MGLIKAATSTVASSLGDQWLEVIEPSNMGQTTVMTPGVKVRPNDKRNANKKGTEDVITDGSVIHVAPNMMMILTDGGKIIDYSAEEGYYTVKNDAAPSLFNGNLKDAIQESFERFKFGGVTPQKQKVYFINLQEIKGIKFGTPTPLNYFDNFYNAELFLRTHGTYSIKITDPLLFYKEAIPRNMDQVEIDDINEQYLSEFLTALQAAINQMSAAGERISFVPSKSMELSKYMADVLDPEWRQNRGMEVFSVAVASISYTEDSQKLIGMRNQGAMLQDPNIREGFVQGSIAKGMEEAGKNPNGATQGFVGMGMGMGQAGNYFAQASKTNQEQAQQQGNQNTNTGNRLEMRCQNCHEVVDLSNGVPKFCPHCGKPFVGEPV